MPSGIREQGQLALSEFPMRKHMCNKAGCPATSDRLSRTRKYP
jgi:hypothetical protein